MAALTFITYDSGAPSSATVGSVKTIDALMALACTASATFTPGATIHTTPAIVGAAAVFSTSVAAASKVLITSASMEVDHSTAVATAFTLYLYNVTPPSASTDSVAWDLPSGDRAAFLGKIDLGTPADLGTTQWVETHGINKQILTAGTALYGYLVNNTTYTPAAAACVVTIHGTVL